MLNLARRSVLAITVLFAANAAAQYQTPVVDGTINPGEYANNSGNWYLTWDATNLYVGVQGNASSDNFAIYLDIDPLSTPGGGTNANGSLTGYPDTANSPGAPLTVTLPFRADGRVAVGENISEYRLRDGAGGWGVGSSNPAHISATRDEATMDWEFRISWEAVTGVPAVPSSFSWLAFKNSASDSTAATDPMPPANPTGTSGIDNPYFFSVASTADGASSDPFATRNSTWRVTSNAASGANTLRTAITNANADSASARRYITFAMSNATITPVTALPNITRTTTLDATTQTGGTSPAVTLTGPGTGSAVTAIRLSNVTDGVVRGFVIGNFAAAIGVINGSGNTIAGNYIGTNAAGDAASANQTGIGINGGTNLTIGGVTAADRNVIAAGIVGISPWNDTNTLIINNYIGTNAAGTSALPNTEGINSFLSNGLTVGAAGAGNVISGNSLAVLLSTGTNASFYDNKIGVGADGTTAIANSDAMLTNDAQQNLVIGSVSDPNIIANNGQGLSIENGGALVVRGNSFFANGSPALSIGNIVPPVPTVSSAQVTSNSTLYLTFSLNASSTSTATQSMQLDLYIADTANSVAQGKTYRATSPCYAGSSLTNQQWVTPAAGASAGIVLIATSYANADCTSAGDGSSAFTSVVTPAPVTPTFTGPGSFSDTTKWNLGALPAAGQDFIVVGACTFDSDAPDRTYGSMTLGSGATAGSITWQAGNSTALQVDDISSAVSGGAITMTDSASTLRIDGSVSTTNLTFTAGGGVVQYDGTNQFIATYTYNNLSVTGSGVLPSGTITVEGTLDVSGTLGPVPGSSLVNLHGTISGSGSIVFHNLTVPSGESATATASFGVGNTFTVSGTFTPSAAVVVNGVGVGLMAGTITGTGTIKVTGTATNSLRSQYTLNRTLTGLTVEFKGAAGQYLDGITFYNLTIDNAAGAEFDEQVTVTGTLALTAGILQQTGGNGLVLTNDSPSALIVTTGWLRSVDFFRRFATGTNSYLYPAGSDTTYAPATVTIHSATAGGDLLGFGTFVPTANIVGSGIDQSRNSDLLWAFRRDSGAFATYDVTMNFNTLVDAEAEPERFVARLFNASTISWSATPSTPAATSISVPGLTATTGVVYVLIFGNQLIETYIVSAQSEQSAGTPFTTTVTAIDALSETVNDSATVVTMTSSTGNAQFDSDGNGTFGDNTKALSGGVFTITTKDNTLETVTFTATDANSKTGTSDEVDINLGPPSRFTTTITPAQSTLTADGTSNCTITVQLKDAGGNNQTTDAATIELSTTTGSLGAASYAGNGSYTATFTAGITAGTATITGTLDGQPITDNGVVILTAGPAATLLVEAPTSATGGSAFNVTVTARDANANTATSYTGIVQFSSTATSATLPSNYTFTGADAGVHTFSITLGTAGNIVLTVTDTVTGSITGSDTVAVTGNTITSLLSSANPSLVGQSVTFTATVSSTTSGTISGTVTFKDGAATLGTGPVSGGTATFTTTSLTQGTHSVTAEYGGNTNFNASTSGAVSQVVNLSPFGPPAILYATAAGTTSVSLAWTAVSGATSYKVYRSSGGGLFTQVASVSLASHSDTGRSANTTYLYKVSAHDGATESALSTVDAATTIVFTDATLSSSILVKKTHVDELRTAVNAMRAAAGLSGATFTDGTITAQSTKIARLHVTELRAALDPARATIGLPALSYTDSAITAGSTKIKGAHITDLRAGTQ
jgi:hypothetical protein